MNLRHFSFVIAAVAAAGLSLAGCAATSTAGAAATQPGPRDLDVSVVAAAGQHTPSQGASIPAPKSVAPQPAEGSPSSPSDAPTKAPTTRRQPPVVHPAPVGSSPAPAAGSTEPSAPAPDPTVAPIPAGAKSGSAEANPADYPGSVTAVGFSSPSGNISCGFVDDGGVVCQIQHFSYTPPKHDCGASGWGFNFRITAAGTAEMFCAGDVESGGPALAYDHSITVNGMQCTSQTSGVTCIDTRTGHGFSLAKAAYRFFGDAAEPPSAATTAAPTSALASSARSIVGPWSGHGRGVDIRADGTAEMTYRIYKFCDDDPTPPCDKVVGNEIHSGGDVRFTLTGDLSGTSAHGKVTSSTDPAHPVGAPVTAGLRGYNLILSIMDAPFCKADAPSREWNCGA